MLSIYILKLDVFLGGQQPQQIFSPGQIIRAPGVLPANIQNVQSLQTVQLPNGQSVAVRPTIPQVVQFPMQQTIPVQVPISSGTGQTIYQTIHFPIQLATAVPNIIQTQQIVPQVANIITPNGPIQQVQIASSVATPQQQSPASQSVTVQAESPQPLTFTGANGQQFTIIPATNLQQVRSNIIQVPNIQTIPMQNIPGRKAFLSKLVLHVLNMFIVDRSRECAGDYSTYSGAASYSRSAYSTRSNGSQQMANIANNNAATSEYCDARCCS